MFLRFCQSFDPQQQVPVESNRGWNPLIEMIVNGEWEKATEIIKQPNNYHLASQWSTAPSLGGSVIATTVLPIHQSCAKANVPLSFIKCLLNANPKSIEMVDTKSMRTPLHLAVANHIISKEVISHLIQKYPQATQQKDYLGRIPLHYASSNSLSLSVLQQLVAFGGIETICATDCKQWTPFLVACRKALTVQPVEFLLSANKTVLQICNEDGDTPLDVVKFNTSPAQKLIVATLLHAEQNMLQTILVQNFQNSSSIRRSDGTTITTTTTVV